MAKLRSSAAFRIAFVYSAMFAIGIALLGVAVFWAMHIAFTRQLDATIGDEATTLAAEFRSDGTSELRDAIAQREATKSPTRLFYAVFAPDGRRLFGSFDTKHPELGLHDLVFVDPVEGPDTARGMAIDLSANERLVVAADREWIEQIDRTIIEVFAVGFLGVCVLGFLATILLGAYLRRRLQAIAAGAEAIIGGDAKGRMPVGPRRDEFDQLAITLNRMLDRIDRLLGNLRQVSSDIAHDLRTPLTRLRNGLAQGEMSAKKDSGSVIEQAIVRVDAVLSLFAAILRIAEIESGETRRFFAEVDLSALVAELAESYELVVRDGGRTLLWSIEPGLRVMGDRELIAQAAINLLENAQRHTPAGSLVRLTLVARGAGARLQVVDNGPGITKADRSRVVERFVRLDHSRMTPGHGLGLSLAHVVAKQHGGQLILKDSNPGLSAVIELPSVHRDSLVPPNLASDEPDASRCFRAQPREGTLECH